MRVKTARNPVWDDAEHTAINVEVQFEDDDGVLLFDGDFLPFTAKPDDSEQHGRDIFADCLKGAFGTIAEYIEPVVSLEELKATKLQELAAWFKWASDDAHLMSSLGFEIDADAVAKRDVDALIEDIEEGYRQEPVYFMGYDNVARPVTYDGLKTIRSEIRANGFDLYQQKWALRSAIEAAQSKAELDAIEIPAVGGSDAGVE